MVLTDEYDILRVFWRGEMRSKIEEGEMDGATERETVPECAIEREKQYQVVSQMRGHNRALLKATDLIASPLTARFAGLLMSHRLKLSQI